MACVHAHGPSPHPALLMQCAAACERAAIYVLRRLTALEEMGYLSPLQLHETNEGIEHMSEALDELLKIAETPPPFPIRQMSS